MIPQIQSIDHFVLVVRDLAVTVDFYQRVLGIPAHEIVQGRWALQIGTQKINLQQLHWSVDANTRHPACGSGDFCLLTTTPLAEVQAHLQHMGIQIVDGPIRRTGAVGPILSIYFYDPDENLVEVSNQL